MLENFDFTFPDAVLSRARTLGFAALKVEGECEPLQVHVILRQGEDSAQPTER